MTWISAGSADAGQLEEHCLVRVAAEELEASKTGASCTGGFRVGGSVFEYEIFFFLILILYVALFLVI